MTDDAYIPPSERERQLDRLDRRKATCCPVLENEYRWLLESHAVVDSVAADWATATRKLKWDLQHMLGDTQETKDAKTLMLRTLARYDALKGTQ